MGKTKQGQHKTVPGILGALRESIQWGEGEAGEVTQEHWPWQNQNLLNSQTQPNYWAGIRFFFVRFFQFNVFIYVACSFVVFFVPEIVNTVVPYL